MGLSGDQKALLRLLAQREQGYDDIAALMGLSVEEVRARVKDALDTVEREGGEPPTLPVEKEEAPREEPKAKKPAAEAPKPPKAEPRAFKPPDPPPAEKPRRGAPALPKERRVLAIGGGLAAIVLVIVLLATGAIGGGDSDSSDSGGSGGDESTQTASSELRSTEEALSDSNLTGAVLRPVDGGDGSGAVLFGKARKQILLQVEAIGLEPSPAASFYTVWLYKSPQLAVRVGAVEAPEGSIRVQLGIPEEVLGLVAAGVFDQVSLALTDQGEYKAEVARARKAGDFPAYTGSEVLRGPIQGPITDIAAKAQRKGKEKSGN